MPSQEVVRKNEDVTVGPVDIAEVAVVEGTVDKLSQYGPHDLVVVAALEFEGEFGAVGCIIAACGTIFAVLEQKLGIAYIESVCIDHQTWDVVLIYHWLREDQYSDLVTSAYHENLAVV